MPTTGRFLGEDPAQDGANWYAYAGNDPVNFRDPFGLRAAGNPLNGNTSFGSLVSTLSGTSFNNQFNNPIFTGPVSTPTLSSFDTSVSSLGTSFNTVSNFAPIRTQAGPTDVNSQYLSRYATDAAFRNQADDAYSQSLLRTEFESGSKLAASPGIILNSSINSGYSATASFFTEPIFAAFDTVAKLTGNAGQRQFSGLFQTFNSDPDATVIQNLVQGGRQIKDALASPISTGLALYDNPSYNNAQAFSDAAVNTVVIGVGASRVPLRSRVAPKGSGGLTFVGENLGTPRNAAIRTARDFESGTLGAFSDVATQQRVVPALRFNNPNPNGAGFVKFDGFQRLNNGIVELIDAKTRIVPFSNAKGPVVTKSVREGLLRKSEAVRQNSGFSAILEFPTQAARQEAQQVLQQLRIRNISTRVR